MKILLVLPAAEHVRVTKANPDVPRRKMLRFSILPLTTVAALTPAEHDVRICDENVEPLDFDAEVDVVGVSFMTALTPRAYEIAAEFRRRGKTVVAGGYHPTLCPAEVAEHFDAVAVGQAEEIWVRMLSDIQAGRLQKLYHGGDIDPALIPQPRRDLTARTARQYATVNAVQAGRGCMHGCRYCSIAAFFGKVYRHRPLETVLQELRGLGRHFMFVDDNIVADPAFARGLFKAMVPMKKRWISQCSLKIADDPVLLELAYRAGCRGLFIGVETLSRENLRLVGKEFNQAEDYLRRIGTIRRHGIGVQAGIIVGMDADDPGVFERTLEFLEKAGIDALQLNIMTPLPGTPLYQQYAEAGRITDRDWSHYDFRHTVIRPVRMTGAELQAGADWLYNQFYRPWRIVRRTWRALWRLGPLAAAVTWRLNWTYRYDNLRERIVGYNPSGSSAQSATGYPEPDSYVPVGMPASSRS
jgi:radical SAM superfamily enzyme YgiQ (UPF0313 family)